MSAHSAHSKYYLNALHECEPDIKGRDQLRALNTIETDFENVRLAWHWAVGTKDYHTIDQAVECLDLFCHFRGRELDGAELFKQAREGLAPQPNEEPHPLWGRVLLRHHEDLQVPDEELTARIEKCLNIARSHDNRSEIAFCLIQLADTVGQAGHRDEALAILGE